MSKKPEKICLTWKWIFAVRMKSFYLIFPMVFPNQTDENTSFVASISNLNSSRHLLNTRKYSMGLYKIKVFVNGII